MNNYERDMYIDEGALDMECLEQPALMVRYTEMLADAKRERDQAKETLDLMYAQIDLAIREDPEKYNLPKITEGAVRSAILMEQQYKDVQKRYNDSNHEVNVLNGVVSAIEQRKNMIEALIKLHGQQYFAGPNVPHDITELRQKRIDKINKGVNKHLKRKRNG